MSLSSEDQCLSDDHAEGSADLARGSRIRYTRDFLLSLSDLDACKKLPEGFDQSILSEFEEASQDRLRGSGSFLSHGFRRTEYGSSPPTRGESGNYSRGIRGRWDSRSSGRSDKDSDSQPDLESESGRRYGSQSRRPWQTSEHDGLLGSGSFPRPSGYATGSSLPKFGDNERAHFNKSSEPYHPPRPYKAAPRPRRETHDSYNDETFGSLECTNEDKVEEERKRRASFELMRKEQVKAIHEKQKLNPNKRKDEFDITMLLEGTSEEKSVINKSSDSEQPVKVPAVSGISEKSLPSQGPACRPLVPPGFKNSGQPDAGEVKNSQPVKAVETELKELGIQSTTGNPASVIEKLFSSASIDGNSTTDKLHGSKADEIWSPGTVQSSKFAQWFLEEDQTPIIDLSSGQKNNLLSLIAGGKKIEAKESDSKATELYSTNAPLQMPKQPDRNITSTCITGNSEQLYGRDEQNSVNAFLTCEDLEQKMLLEASVSDPNSLHHLQGWSDHENIELSKPAVDDQASHHLLSLLQKGTGHKDKTKGEGNTAAINLRNEDAEINPKLGNILTLETLFGNAFMKELQSATAPVSVQRGLSEPVGGDASEPAEYSISIARNGLVLPLQATNTSHGNNVSGPILNEKVMLGGIQEQYIGFHNSKMIADPIHLQINSGFMPGGLGKSAETPLPEAGNLFTLGDPVNPQSLTSANTSVDIADKLASLNYAVRDERSKTGARDGVSLFHGPYNSSGSDLPYNLQVHQSPQLHTPELSHGGQVFHSLSSHSANIITPMNFMPPDVTHHNSPPNQYSVDVFRPPFHHAPSGVTAFDQPSHHPMLQQMYLRGSVPPAHLFRGIPPGVPLQPRPSNQVAGFVPELSRAQGLPLSHRLPNFDGPSVPMPASQLSGSSNHPEALQRLIEMELRSKPKQIHPFASAGLRQPDMGFGYNR